MTVRPANYILLGAAYVACLMFGLALLAPVAMAQRAVPEGPDAIFTVSNYPVEARAADAVAAKAKAMADGERAAFRSLLRRLVPVTAYARVRRISPPKMSQVLEGVSVRSERNSTTEYAANIDFTFNAKAVRDLLDREGLPYADQQARAVVVVPVWQTPASGPLVPPASMTADQGPKAWNGAWRSLDLTHALTPVKLETLKPDLDAATIKAFAGGNLSVFTKIASAYGTERVLIAFAEPDLGAKRLNVTLIGQDARGAIQWKRGYRIDTSDPSYTIEAAAVISLGVMEGRWKGAVSRPGRNELTATEPTSREPGREPPAAGGWSSAVEPAGTNPGPGSGTGPAPSGGRQTIAVEFRGMGEWTDISRKLSAVQGLEELDVIGMNQRGARVTARVTQPFPDLQRALAAQGLALRNTGGQWTLTAQ